MISSAPFVGHHTRAVLLVHLVWATAARKPILAVAADAWLVAVFERKAREYRSALAACGNSSDHVHVLVRYPSTVAVAELVKSFKGYSSYEWNAKGRAPRLAWQPGYWAESVSVDDAPAVIAYVTNQRRHHAHAVGPESWEPEGADDFCD